MSPNTPEDNPTPAAPASDAETTPVRKTTARKRVAKAAATEGEITDAPAAKKAARKTARKKSTEATAGPAADSPAPPPPAAAEAAGESAPAKSPRARKTAKPKPAAAEAAAQAATPAPAPATHRPAETAEPPQVTLRFEVENPPAAERQDASNRRIGRVPGGGPRVSTPNPARDDSSPHSSGQPPHGSSNGDGPQRESRSKRRREKRKRKKGQFPGPHEGGGNSNQGQGGPSGNPPPPRNPQGRGDHPRRHSHGGDPHGNRSADPNEHRNNQLSGPKIACEGLLEIAPKGFGFLRVPAKQFEQARDDVFVTPEMIRKANLRHAQWIRGEYQEGTRGSQLVEITDINGLPAEQSARLPHFDELKAVNPAKRISFETTPERFTTRVVDIMAPVGRGQRGLIVSPPRSGKTTLLLHMAEAIREKYDESIHLMVLLVDERPEEVTEFRRALPGAEIYASSNDEQPRNHCRIAELAIERAKRLVEAGKDVFLLMDSITRLARAYNNTMNQRGRATGSGGITIGALEVPRRLFAAARNTRGGGSLTILATALIQTNSRADEAIFMEFKGTGNMELVLDRKIAENYLYPAVDIFKSGTRREEILLPEHMLHKIHLIRRGLSGHRPVEAMERLLFFLKKFPNNPQMLLEIKG